MRDLLQSGFRNQEAVFDADGADTRYHIFRFEREHHVRFEPLFRAGRKYRELVYLDADAVPHEFGLLLGPHEVGAESLFFGDFGSYLIEFGTRCSRPGDIFDLAFDKKGCLMRREQVRAVG